MKFKWKEKIYIPQNALVRFGYSLKVTNLKKEEEPKQVRDIAV